VADDRDIRLVYDRQCPVCELYCRLIDVREDEGRLVRVDARDNSDILDEITALGLDIDEGMVLKVDSRLYYGSEAIHELALLSSGRGFFNALSCKVFGSRDVAKTVYPVMKALRNLLLKILGRSRINNLDVPGRTRF
jgi:predicted DCC family thiol-disulfide oxidoreductase YuxK